MPRATLIYPDQELEEDDGGVGADFGPVFPKGSGRKYNMYKTASTRKSEALIKGSIKGGKKFLKQTKANGITRGAAGKRIKSGAKKAWGNAKRKAKKEFNRRKNMLKNQAKNAGKKLLKTAQKAICDKLDKLLVIPEPALLATLKTLKKEGSIEYKTYWPLKVIVEKDYADIAKWMKEEAKLSVMYGTSGRIFSSAWQKGATKVAVLTMGYKKTVDPNFETNKYKYMKEILTHCTKNFTPDIIEGAINDFKIDLSAFGPGNKEHGKQYVLTDLDIDIALPEIVKAGKKFTVAKNIMQVQTYRKLLSGLGDKNENKIVSEKLNHRVNVNPIIYFETVQEALDIAEDILAEHGADTVVNLITSPEQAIYLFLVNLRKRDLF